MTEPLMVGLTGPFTWLIVNC